MKKKFGYMCQTDFDYHLENDKHPQNVYVSVAALEKARSCVRPLQGCGIVKVELTVVEVVREGEL